MPDQTGGGGGKFRDGAEPIEPAAGVVVRACPVSLPPLGLPASLRVRSIEPRYLVEGMVAQVEINFDWHPEKAKQNLRKHKVSFEQAATIFQDPMALSVFDEGHSDDEERWSTIGRAKDGATLVVVHISRREDRRHRNPDRFGPPRSEARGESL